MVGVAIFQILLQAQHLPHRLVHDLHGVDAVGGIRAVTALAGNADRLRHMPLVGHHRHQSGRLANHGVVGFQFGRRGDGAGPRHGGLFVGSGENTQRLVELGEVNLFERLDDKGEEALHIDGAEAIEAVALFGHLEGVLAPAPLIERHRIGVTRQQQTALPLTDRRHQIELARQIGERRYLALKTELTEPVSQQPDHRLVALIPLGIRAADRGNRNNILIK